MTQVVIEATNLRVVPVEWPEVEPLVVLPDGTQVMQIHFYSPVLNRWVKWSAQKSGDRTAVELTFEDLWAVQSIKNDTGSTFDAIKSVLGFYPGES